MSKIEGTSSARVSISAISGKSADITLVGTDASALTSAHHVLSFWAKADRNRALGPIRLRLKDADTLFADLGTVAVTPNWQWYELPFVAAALETSCSTLPAELVLS